MVKESRTSRGENFDLRVERGVEISWFFFYKDCKNWTFGLSCDECACVQLHSEFCNKKNGQCHCKQGYTGVACQCEDNGEPCQHRK